MGMRSGSAGTRSATNSRTRAAAGTRGTTPSTGEGGAFLLMTELPRPEGTRTVTFLFTDIEGSTRLWEQHPDAMRLALARHDARLRAAIETNGGHVFKTVGDAFCAAFPTATQALDAALIGQRNLLADS